MAERQARSTRTPRLQRCYTPAANHGKVRSHCGWFRAGGQRAANSSGKVWKRAALIEKLESDRRYGDQHRTIPSKTIREAVLHLSGYQYQSIYGVNYRVKEQITMADLSFRAAQRHQNRDRCHSRATFTQRHRSCDRNRELFGSPPHASDEFARTSRV